jgi:triacylglycerol lipase
MPDPQWSCRQMPSNTVDTPIATAVLVHGILDTGRIFRPLTRRLAEAQVEVVAPDLTPNYGSARLETLADQLAAVLAARLVTGRPTFLIGFSMGALVSRYYLQRLGGHARIAAFFSVAAPHAGTLWSHLGALPGMRQMRPGSAFLRGLNADISILETVPTVTYRTPYDLVVVPAHSATLPFATNLSIPSWCHQCLLSHPQLLADIPHRVVTAVATAAHPSEVSA